MAKFYLSHFFGRNLFWLAILLVACVNQELSQPPNVNPITPVTETQTSDSVPHTDNSVCQIGPISNLPNYKKKIAIAAFPLAYPQHAPDIPRISYEWPLFLARELRASGDFIVRDIEDVNIFDGFPQISYLVVPRTDLLQDNYRLADLAEKIDAQFIISGVIHDFSFTQSNFSLLGLSFDERMMRVELFIHDGWSGMLVDKQIFSQKIVGKVTFPEITHVDSAAFLNSNIGQAFQKIIANQVQQIKTKLNLFPLIERVLRVEDENIIFNAGAEQNINVGDSLLIFSVADKYANAVYYQNTRVRGYSEKAKSQLTVHQVHPLFSLGTLDIKVPVYPTDVVRSW